MKACVRLCLPAVLCALLAVVACSSVPTLPISKDNLQLEFHPDADYYFCADTLIGALTFASKAEWRIRETFPDGILCQVDLYDFQGNLRRSYYPSVQGSADARFELDPFATRTDTFRLPLSLAADTLPLYGDCRVVAWMEGHPDVSSEATIVVYA